MPSPLLPTLSAPSLFGPPPRSKRVAAAVAAMADSDAQTRGAVNTRPAVAAFVLDLAGYAETADLSRMRLLEPSFGSGVFLHEAVGRLLRSWALRGGRPDEALSCLSEAVRAVEVHQPTFAATRARLGERLQAHGIGRSDAEALLDQWLVCDDFLLTPLAGPFDAVVGNPPYLRQDSIDAALLSAYRKMYATIYDRADLYVPFIERGLSLLAPSGRLTYICADRWMKNRYGGPLRALVSERYRLLHAVDMHGAPAFEGEVDAYPSVFTVERADPDGAPPTLAAPCPVIEAGALTALADRLNLGDLGDGEIQAVPDVAAGDAPWVLDAGPSHRLLRRLEAEFPALEDAACQVGIGVASGADRVFIRPVDELPIEPDRILPLAKARDIQDDGCVSWSGMGLANPYEPDGRLVDLDRYPLLRAYFEAHEGKLRGRHVGKRDPERWYRTIDRIVPGLAERPKLFVPDIKGGAVVAYDEGRLYPHHNLYVVTSDTWELRALQAVLRSQIAEFQVAAYAVRMRGGYLRFQAQYLRRIRLPLWESVPQRLRRELSDAATGARHECDNAAATLYALSEAERSLILNP